MTVGNCLLRAWESQWNLLINGFQEEKKLESNILKEEIKKLDTPPPTPPPEIVLPEEKRSINVGDSDSLLKETNELNNKETHVKRESTVSNESNLPENDIQINVANATNLKSNASDDSENNATLETVKPLEAETATIETTLGMLLLILWLFSL